MALKGVMAVTLRYFTELGKPAFQHITTSARKKGSSCSLSHLLMSFLFISPTFPTISVPILTPSRVIRNKLVLVSGPCNSLNCLGHFKNVRWWWWAHVYYSLLLAAASTRSSAETKAL